VKRQKGNYFVTAIDKVVLNAHKFSVKYYWKLRAIDTLGEANNNTTSKEERSETMDLMTWNLQIWEILLSTT
jgi:hypothetical protein